MQGRLSLSGGRCTFAAPEESSYHNRVFNAKIVNNTSPVLRLHSLATQSLEAVIRYLIVFDIVILASKHFKGDVRRLSPQQVNLVKHILL